mmetsp:Transcript_35274/g.77217  ORF Transcript_35274/g.77217 Transcript_35274/m.77217 type:complete len:239 (-) Transcript_35274:183-899(-)
MPPNRYVNEDDVSQHLKCGICQEVFVDPVSATPCGHSFCRKCIMQWLQRQSTCPECRQKTKKQGLLRNLIAHAMILDLHVHCQYNSCGWTGVVDRVAEHEKACIHNPATIPAWVFQGAGTENQPPTVDVCSSDDEPQPPRKRGRRAANANPRRQGRPLAETDGSRNGSAVPRRRVAVAPAQQASIPTTPSRASEQNSTLRMRLFSRHRNLLSEAADNGIFDLSRSPVRQDPEPVDIRE